MFELDGKVALITGGTRGIGIAYAKHVLAAGGKVVVNGRSGTDESEALISEFGHDRVALELADVSKPAEATSLVEAAGKKFGRLDVLCHAAGGPAGGKATEISPEDWNAAFDIHVHAAFHLFRAAHPHLAKEGGAVILVSSVAGIRGCPGTVAYQTVKGALIPFAKALAFDHASEGIRVNVIAPGIIRTRFHDGMSPEAKKHNLENRILVGREGTVDDVASAMMELTRNGFVTGEVFVVDGGMSMRVTG